MCPSKRTIIDVHSIFRTGRPIVNLNNICQLRGNQSVFNIIRARTDGQSDRPTNNRPRQTDNPTDQLRLP